MRDESIGSSLRVVGYAVVSLMAAAALYAVVTILRYYGDIGV